MRNQRFEEERQANNGFAPYYGFAAVAVGMLISLCVLVSNALTSFLVILAYFITACGLMSLSKLNKKMKTSSILAFILALASLAVSICVIVASASLKEGETIFTDDKLFKCLQFLLSGLLIISFEGIFIKALNESAVKYKIDEFAKKCANLFNVVIVSGIIFYGLQFITIFHSVKGWIVIIAMLYWGIVQFAVMALAYNAFDKFDKNADKIRKYKII